MKLGSFSIVWITALASVLAVIPAPTADAQIQTSRTGAVKAAALQTTELFTDALARRKYKEAVAHFDSKMASLLSVEQLEGLWIAVLRAAGPFVSYGEPEFGYEEGLLAVYVPATFRKQKLTLKILVNDQSQVAGFWIKPGKSGPPYKPPAYDKPQRYTEEEVEFGYGQWVVPGKLTRPRDRAPAPVVVLVHGSGPHDADETIGPNKPFRDLAAGLSSNGVAVLRYQKRTFTHKMKLMQLGGISLREEVLDDAIEALSFVRAQKGIDRNKVYLLGHSLGGTLAPHIAKEDGQLAGVILLAAAARNPYDLIEEQLAYIAALSGPKQEDNEKRLQETREAIARARSGSAPLDTKVLGAPAWYWTDVNRYAAESLGLLAGLKCRVRVLGAGRDYQVTRKDFDLYRDALKDHKQATFQWYNDLNHLFAPGKGKSTPQESKKPGHVDEKVIQDLTQWIKQ